jgi:hypothetical protein
MTLLWNDWLTESRFHIRISSASAAKLHRLPADTQLRLRRMLLDIAELADLAPITAPVAGFSPLLHIQIGRLSVRYRISEERRELAVEQVIPPEEPELERAG